MSVSGQKNLGRTLFVAMLCGTALSACSGSDSGSFLGLEKQTPDEFAVVSRAPLTLPPNYGLRPPDPNGQRNQDIQPQLDAQRALFGAEAVQRRQEEEARLRAAGATAGDLALLDRTGAIDADPNIRRVVDQETAALAAEQDSFVDDLVFWKDKPETGDVVDAEEESRRIQSNAALGQSVTEGQTPIITREGEKSFFQWPF